MARRSNRLSSAVRPLVTVAVILVGAYFLWPKTGAEEVPDYTGEWTITNTVTNSSYRNYIGEVYVYKIYVIQDGSKMTGEGEQTLYNGKVAAHHYAIALTDGSVKGDDIVVRYRMQASREITGMFTLRPDPDQAGVLRGTFTSSSAATRGTCAVVIRAK